ncbi:CsiV family protein [Halopseudomonas phragmitis]|uniref:Peptidoglycan-binding protein, CsiV n=1 Tax=Halopseudomonas phragmitis TaxID=1931241 RepID=A0A1V0B6N6_9GAMM|nr:CsiV family protein [Halopseudomonas phragmitis]AQZ95602.1 hypothetical protein BVH74_12955 [Halopseudomonas phragmitis]
MNHPLRIFTLLLILALGWAGLAQAQSEQIYQVEVVVFSQASGQLAAGQGPGSDWAERAVLLDSTARSDVRNIDQTRYRLGTEARRLNDQGYRVRLHKAWEQPADDSLRVAVTSGTENALGIYPVQGLVRLSQERALEADVSFWLNHNVQGQAVSEHLRQNRRLRVDEVHYLDHQGMGMLIRVSRL